MILKKYSWQFILCLLVLPLNSICQNQIIWCDTCKLKWSDFEGQVPHGTRFGAISTFGLSAQYYVKKKYVKAEIFAYFKRDFSWVRSETDAGLVHEQAHFDLAEVYCRKFRKHLIDNRIRKIFARRQMGRLYRKFNGEMAHAQKKYDYETNFGANNEAQQRWNEWILNELESLARVSKTKIQIPYK